MIQKRIDQSDRAHERQDKPQLAKAQPHGNPRNLIQRDGKQRHHREWEQRVFGEGHKRDNIDCRNKQLAQRVQAVQRGDFGSQGVHFPQLRLRVREFVHKLDSFICVLLLREKVLTRDCHNRCVHWFRNDKLGQPVMSLRGAQRRGNPVQELPSTHKIDCLPLRGCG